MYWGLENTPPLTEKIGTRKVGTYSHKCKRVQKKDTNKTQNRTDLKLKHLIHVWSQFFLAKINICQNIVYSNLLYNVH